MLPVSHIAYTLLSFDLLQKRIPAFKKADLRLVALAATGPDLLDKPLAALYFYRRFKSAMLFAHTLLAQLAVIAVTAIKMPGWWPYALAFVLHGLQDRLWLFRDTFWWPLRGWRFHVWKKRGSEQRDIKWAYWYAFTRRPELWIWEVLGVLALVWFVARNRLYLPERLWHLIRTGHLPE
jgi:LexA-binding, inner membrane-associated putative hydrolase